MRVKRILLWGVGGGAAVAWIAAAATSVSTPVSSPSRATPRRDRAASAALAAEVSRLHERLRPSAAPSQTRDLFRYAERPVAPPPRPALAPVTEAAVPVVPVTRAPFKLIGIAADSNDGTPVRTAIVAGEQGELYFAKAGETISQFTVVTVLDDAVEVADPTEPGRVVRLTLP